MNTPEISWPAETQLTLTWMQVHGDDVNEWEQEDRKDYECEAAHLRVGLLEAEVVRLRGLIDSYRALELGRQSQVEAMRRQAPCGARSESGDRQCEKPTGHTGYHQLTGDSCVWAWG